MKKAYKILIVLLSVSNVILAQFKGVNMKKMTEFDKPIYLRSFAIKAPKLPNGIYKLVGKIPGKADAGFITHDSTDKHSFLLMARYWNKQKKFIKDDEYALKFYSREFTPPKGYEGKVVEEKFFSDKNGIIYVRKYARAFNEKEQDSIEMAEVTYVSMHPKLRKEVIVFDLLMIGDQLEVAPSFELAKQFIDQIAPLDVYYDKKWNIQTELNIIGGTDMVNTNLAYITKWESNGNARFARADFNPTFVTGPSIWGARHLAKNYWLRGGLGVYPGSNSTYDSLYSTKELDMGYFSNPVIYNVEFKTSDFKYFSIGVEKRLFLNGRNSINVYLNLRQSFGQNYFELTANDWGTGNKNVHRVSYSNPFGFDLGVKYQHCFKYHHWGLNGGLGFSYSTYNFKGYTVNGLQGDIESAPYFIPEMKTMDVSGLSFMMGAFYQF